MSTKIRLTRMGRRNRPYYRMVIADSKTRRDGKYIELIGSYDPMKDKAERVIINEDRALYWLGEGAQPSDTIRNIFSEAGIMLKFHLSDSSISDEQRNQQMQKYELARKARLGQSAPAAKTVKAAAPAKEVAESVEEAVEEEAVTEEKKAVADDVAVAEEAEKTEE